jgi:hypothetical protein
MLSVVGSGLERNTADAPVSIETEKMLEGLDSSSKQRKSRYYDKPKCHNGRLRVLFNLFRGIVRTEEKHYKIQSPRTKRRSV